MMIWNKNKILSTPWTTSETQEFHKVLCNWRQGEHRAVHKVRQYFFFAIFDTPSSMWALFYTYPSALFPQFLTPPPLKSSDLLYGRPPRCMVTWSLSLTSNMFPLTDAHKSIMCATVYIVHHIVRLKLLHWVDNASSVCNTTR